MAPRSTLVNHKGSAYFLPFTTLRPAPRNYNGGVWTGTFYRSRLARSQCSTLPAGSGFRDGGIDAVGSLPQYWRVIERATDEQWVTLILLRRSNGTTFIRRPFDYAPVFRKRTNRI